VIVSEVILCQINPHEMGAHISQVFTDFRWEVLSTDVVAGKIKRSYFGLRHEVKDFFFMNLVESIVFQSYSSNERKLVYTQN